ncbi:MAG: flagellin [Aquamicrobium sp.]|nr:flagellin [Aquamicrobium sp.]
MSSLNTNASAMTALQTLAATNKNLATTQSRISTGFRVNEAKDNAAYWSIATTMRSDNKAFSAVQDALGLGAGRLDVAYTAMESAITAVDLIKQKLVSAMSASEEDKLKIQTEIKELQGQLTGIGLSANYAGSNVIAHDGTLTELEIVSSYDRSSDGSVTVNTIKLDLSGTQLLDETGTGGGILDDVMQIELDGTEDNAAIQAHLDNVETALAAMAAAAATIGAAKSRVDMQKDFVSKLQDAIDRGIGQLVDADMNKESSRLSALQVQQQLGIQALSIANSNTQNILSLFRS